MLLLFVLIAIAVSFSDADRLAKQEQAERDSIIAAEEPLEDSTRAAEEATREANEALQEEQEAAENVSQAGSLGITPDEFRRKWNDIISGTTSDELRIRSLGVRRGEVQDVFQVTFTPRLGMMGTVNKSDGTIRDVMIIGQVGSDRISDAGNMLLAWAALVGSANPSLAPEKRGTVLENLGIMDGDTDLATINRETTVDGVRYYVRAAEGLGMLFGAPDPLD